VRVDGSGYALVPYMTPYALNTLQLDPQGLSLDVQLNATSAQVAPHAGAVVMVKFKTENGRSVILRIHQVDGQSVPFGSEIVDEKDQSVGVVGQAGQALVRVAKDAGQLKVQWTFDSGTPMSCGFAYKLTPVKKGYKVDAFEKIDATCTPTRTGT
jgi:outer membrane usher protein